MAARTIGASYIKPSDYIFLRLAFKFLTRKQKAAAGVILRDEPPSPIPSMPLLGGGRLEPVAEVTEIHEQTKVTFLSTSRTLRAATIGNPPSPLFVPPGECRTLSLRSPRS